MERVAFAIELTTFLKKLDKIGTTGDHNETFLNHRFKL